MVKIARPCKSANVTTGHFSKEEIDKRIEVEGRLKGGVSNLKPPTYFNKEQKKIFKYIVDQLKASGILSNLDIYVLSACSIAISRLIDIEKEINKDIAGGLRDKDLLKAKSEYTKDFFRCCNELCLSPQGRAKIGSLVLQAKEEEEDLLKKALKGDDDED